MTFDPYESWLGIPNDRRPPTYYDLLGLPCFEPDPSTIEQAALRRMARVRQHQIGPQSDQSQQILSELARARLILIDPDRRSEYDTKLRAAEKRLSPIAALPQSAGNEEATLDLTDAIPDVLNSIVISADDAYASSALRPKKRGSSVLGQWLVAAFFMSLHGALLAGGYFYVYVPRTEKQDRPLVKQNDLRPRPPKPRVKPVRAPSGPAAPVAANRPPADAPIAKANPPSDIQEPPTVAPNVQNIPASPASPPTPPIMESRPHPEPLPPSKKIGRTLTSAEQSALKAAQSKLDDVRAKYEKARHTARTNLLKAFEVTMRQLNANPDVAPADRVIWLDQLSKEKEGFKDRQELPQSPWMIGPLIHYQGSIYASFGSLEFVANTLINLYRRTGQPDEALALANELKDSERETGKADLFVVGTHWVGERFVLPDNKSAPFALRILGREGKTFTAEATFGNEFAVARGTGLFDGFKMTFATESMIKGPPRDWRLSGFVLGDGLVANFQGVSTKPDGTQFPLEGFIRLGLTR